MSIPSNPAETVARPNRRLFLRATSGVLLILVGLALVLPRPYHERTFLIDAGGCRLQTTVFDPPGVSSPGTVVLLPGLATNRKIMSYLAEGFAAMRLRVFVPDLPGHGKTGGTFSTERAEECSENLLHELRSRGLAPPDKTILAGHSMGAAIAIRVAVRVPVAGVIAISPAPTRAEHGLTRDMLLYDDPPSLPPFTEVISGGLELPALRANAAELLQPARDVHSHYDVIPFATHSSLLADPRAVRLAQAWTAQALHLDAISDHPAPQPSRTLPLFGALCGLAGMFLLSGPFLREAAGKTFAKAPADESANNALNIPPTIAPYFANFWRNPAKIFVAAMLVVVLLKYWAPFNLFRLFEGDYLAGFLLLTGVALLVAHSKQCRDVFDFRSVSALGAIFAAAVLFLLFSAWFELSLSEAWLDAARWQRFPLLFLALLPWLMVEELVLGPFSPHDRDSQKSTGPNAPSISQVSTRLLRALSYRLILWLPLLLGVGLLHNGQILLVLLAPYIAIFSIAHRRGMDIVREVTGSPAAAALFGAILLAGFFLVIFPLR